VTKSNNLESVDCMTKCGTVDHGQQVKDRQKMFWKKARLAQIGVRYELLKYKIVME